MAENVNISKACIEKAKIVSTKIEDKSLRKRAYALNIIANVAAEYLSESGLEVETNHSLYRIPSFAEKLEFADIYINGIRLDVRLCVDGKTFCIPKIQEKYDAKPCAYVVVQLSKDLSSAEILGFVPTKDLSPVQSNTEYLPYNVSVLMPVKELKVFLAEIKQEQQIFSAADHEKVKELCSSFVEGELSDSENVYFMKHVIACPVCREVFCEFGGFDAIVTQVKNYPELLNDSTLSVLSGNKQEVDEAALANMGVVENEQETTAEFNEQLPYISEENSEESLEELPIEPLEENMTETTEEIVEEKEEESLQENDVEEPVIQPEEEPETLDVSEDLPPILPMGAPLLEETVSDDSEKEEESDDLNDFLLDLSEDQEQSEDTTDEDETPEKEENDVSLEEKETEDFADLNTEDTLPGLETPEEENLIALQNDEDNLLLQEEEDSLPLIQEPETLEETSPEPEAELHQLEENKEDFEPLKTEEDDLQQIEPEQDVEPVQEAEISNDDNLEKTEDVTEEEIKETPISYSQEPVELVYDEEETEEQQPEEITEEETSENTEKTVEEPEKEDNDETDKLSQTDEDIQALLDDDLMALLSEGNDTTEQQKEEQTPVLDNEPAGEEEKQPDDFTAFSYDAPSQQQEPSAETVEEPSQEDETIESLYSGTTVPEQNGNDPAQFELAAEPVSEKTVNATKKIIVGAAILLLLAGGGAVSWYFNNSKTPDNTALETANQDGEFFDLTNNAVQKEDQTPAVSQDINKSMANSFSDKPAAITITKLSWQVSEKLAADASVKEYLQTAGKNIQMNLQNDLANSADINFNNIVKVSFTIAQDNTMKGMQVLESSGSDQIDEIVLRSIKNTLKYVSVPKVKDFKSDYFLTLIINF